MSKLVLLSILFATVALPLYASKAERPGRALRNSVFLLLAFNAFYLVAVRYLYARM
jgi:hypothetical protein